jgi:hypothetical protein
LIKNNLKRIKTSGRAGPTKNLAHAARFEAWNSVFIRAGVPSRNKMYRTPATSDVNAILHVALQIECTSCPLLNKPRSRGTSRFRQGNTKGSQESSGTKSVRNTACMFHRFSMFSFRIRWPESSTWEFPF